MLMRMSINMLALFTSAIVVAGWYAIIPGLLLATVGGFLGLVYLKCQLSIRREVSNAKAPVMSQIGTALNSLREPEHLYHLKQMNLIFLEASIRAYGAQERFGAQLRARIDTMARAFYTFTDIDRWIAVRIDTLCGIFAASITTYLVYGGKVSAGTAGFTLAVVLTFARELMWWVRTYTLFELQGRDNQRCSLTYFTYTFNATPSPDSK